MPEKTYTPIGDLVRPLCERFDLEYESVGEITIKPDRLQVLVYKRRNGSFYVDEDGEAAHEMKSFHVMAD